MAASRTGSRWRQRFRFRLGTLLALVALSALMAWGYVLKGRWDNVQRASQRVQWARRLFQKGYVSQAVLRSEEAELRRARFRLGM